MRSKPASLSSKWSPNAWRTPGVGEKAMRRKTHLEGAPPTPGAPKMNIFSCFFYPLFGVAILRAGPPRPSEADLAELNFCCLFWLAFGVSPARPGRDFYANTLRNLRNPVYQKPPKTTSGGGASSTDFCKSCAIIKSVAGGPFSHILPLHLCRVVQLWDLLLTF